MYIKFISKTGEWFDVGTEVLMLQYVTGEEFSRE